MAKKTIDMVALPPSKANAQHFTCFITFIATGLLAVAMLLVACVLPAMVSNVTEIICWISMGLEGVSIGLGFVAMWIKRNAL
jgi:hypothetical protein